MLHQIGAGVLGPVLRAHESGVDRLIAIKVFRLDLSRTQARELAAELERLIQTRLSHPSIVAPIAAGVEAGDPYLAMEYVAADSLDAALRRHGPPPASDILRLATQLAGAVDYSATVGVNHGALHPRDVLVAAGNARITGFGIARALERVGIRVPIRRPYGALERIAGRDWDQTADVFSVATIIHELIVGRGSTREPRPSPAAALHTGTVDDIFAKAKAAEPDVRYPTAAAFVAALAQAAHDVGAPPQRVQTPAVAKRLQPAERTAPRHPPDDTATGAAEWSSVALDRGSLDEGGRFSTVEQFEAHATPEPNIMSIDEWQAAPDAERPRALDGQTLGRQLLLDRRSDEGSRRSWALALALVVALLLGAVGWYEFRVAKETAPRAANPPADATPRAGATSGERVRPAPAAKEWTEGAVPEDRRAPRAAGQASVAAPRTAGAEPQPVSEPGRMLVRSTPAGADVSIDGASRGHTPLPVRDVAFGTYTVRVTRPGYEAQERRVVVRADRPAVSVDFVLRPSGMAATSSSPQAGGFGSLFVDSQPPRAVVYVDGRLVARTPLLVSELPPGQHTLRLEYDGHQAWSRSVRIVAGERTRVTASLVPRSKS